MWRYKYDRYESTCNLSCQDGTYDTFFTDTTYGYGDFDAYYDAYDLNVNAYLTTVTVEVPKSTVLVIYMTKNKIITALTILAAIVKCTIKD